MKKVLQKYSFFNCKINNKLLLQQQQQLLCLPIKKLLIENHKLEFCSTVNALIFFLNFSSKSITINSDQNCCHTISMLTFNLNFCIEQEVFTAFAFSWTEFLLSWFLFFVLFLYKHNDFYALSVTMNYEVTNVQTTYTIKINNNNVNELIKCCKSLA